MRPLSTSLGTTLCVLASGLAISAIACSGDEVCTADASAALSGEGGAARDGGDAGDATTSADADAAKAQTQDGTAGEDAAPVPLASLRLANWAAGAPAVDLCLAPHGTKAFEGPLLGSRAAQLDDAGLVDAGAPAVPFPDVTAYFLVAVGQYDARLVVAGAPDCTVPIGADATGLPPLATGAAMTVALMGDPGGTPGLGLVGFLDATNASGSNVTIRFINAAPGIASADFGQFFQNVSFIPTFTSVAYGEAGTVDGLTPDAVAPVSETYAQWQPASQATFAATPASGTSNAMILTGEVTLAGGAVITMVLVPPPPGTVTTSGLPGALLECVDNAGVVGLLGNCQVVSQ